MLTGARLRTFCVWPDGVVDAGPEGGFAGEALMLRLLSEIGWDGGGGE
jgi:hypothetical protein